MNETPTETRNLPVPVTFTNEPRDDAGWFARVLRSLFRWKAGSMRADLKVVLEASAPGESGFSPEESTMLKNILGLRERRVAHVMVPRADIVAVQEDIPLGELMKVFEKAAHSRLVVYKDTLDDPSGMVHIRDLVAFMTERATVAAKPNSRSKKARAPALNFKSIDLKMTLAVAKIVRPILFVPPSMPALDLLAKMQATRIHLALVIDEYGGSDGIVSIEDLVELIVGDIEDEHDEASEHLVLRQPDGSFIAAARASLDDVVAMVGAEFNVSELSEDVDTLGGYLVSQLGRLPGRGELIPGPGPYEIEVLDADPRRVKRVKIYRSRQPQRHEPLGNRESDGARAPQDNSASSKTASRP